MTSLNSSFGICFEISTNKLNIINSIISAGLKRASFMRHFTNSPTKSPRPILLKSFMKTSSMLLILLNKFSKLSYCNMRSPIKSSSFLFFLINFFLRFGSWSFFSCLSKPFLVFSVFLSSFIFASDVFVSSPC